jgi:His-Xaa-Ser system radical SAM maturase HxsC
MGKLTTEPVERDDRAGHTAYVTAESVDRFARDFEGYESALFASVPVQLPSIPAVSCPPNLEYLTDGDVVQLHPSGLVQVLYRRSSPHNTLLATERCNSFCLMCSQPPRDVDDSFRVQDTLRLLDLVSRETVELGISGGEPTLLGQGLLQIIEKAKRVLPETALHILTNARRFSDARYARALSEIWHHDLMLGIPLYSDIDHMHDYVVQAAGAYDETIQGLYNLARSGVRIELRVVLHKQTVARLPRLAEFIARNVPFVEHVALMGLEMTGFTPQNLDKLWIDPAEYSAELERATRHLVLAGMQPRIYNHQLCTIPRSMWPYAVKSISDWKNVYLPECAACAVQDDCGGFFQSGTKRHSAHIQPIRGSIPAWLGSPLPMSIGD